MFDAEKARTLGIDEKTIAVLEEVDENDRKEESCEKHEFGDTANESGQYVCKNCGCEESLEFVVGYERGLEHGRTVNINAETVGHLIRAHIERDDERFMNFAQFLADTLAFEGDKRSERIIRSSIDGTYKDS